MSIPTVCSSIDCDGDDVEFHCVADAYHSTQGALGGHNTMNDVVELPRLLLELVRHRSLAGAIKT